MNTKSDIHPKSLFILLFSVLLITLSLPAASGVSVVNWGNHHHSYHGYGPGPYGRGGYFFGGGGWEGPNVIINVPAAPYYAPPPPVCRDVEVCTPYNECWIERQCA